VLHDVFDVAARGCSDLAVRIAEPNQELRRTVEAETPPELRA
jgi:hypothetical protein